MSESPAALAATESRDHAERMDRMYRYQRHIYDLTRKYYLLGRDHMIARLDLQNGGSLLEIGCGTGRNLVLARRHFPHANLFGLDISAEMLATAQAKFEGKASRPRLEVADATTFRASDFGQPHFDRVMISYALSMIPDWQSAIDRGIEALAPDGSLHIVDFGQQERLPHWFQRGLQAWLARFHVTPRPDLKSVLDERAAAQGLQLRFKPLCRGYAWHAVITR
ncbi:S-adenosylmethionine-diacylgycerolhomoserine-N-methyltransferase [Agrobacterium albertimagni AOL15]|uniref:S-adenosylmethionine-diacylgycerolhomoserine-N-methyltransferase n=1 Tax=Agrobacterium albertimagni AOL15 TaxID=1156935 RepID=K2Q146_9HYPH|nr:class I SAM-dependent methyltransferase [Agrobacterium albertimagni]EKF57384.1 S-adenosylmethionine-diacylgycerolhomoserine-N-methyltransferase [Agrobacterium albertimagni AOL15]